MKRSVIEQSTNFENLKIMIEIFCPKLILAFLDYLKPKIFFVSQLWWPA